MNIKRIFGKASWFLTALGSIQVGLATGFGGIVRGVDLFYPLTQIMNIDMVLSFVALFHFLVGVAGIMSLVMFFTQCCGCE